MVAVFKIENSKIRRSTQLSLPTNAVFHRQEHTILAAKSSLLVWVNNRFSDGVQVISNKHTPATYSHEQE